ncbi:TolC family protein [Roseiconus nitratireducens]|uniref:TolC family protein n=1 Tax=Roseiconus nitratireducens TaxID=2605748 RepID=A0A5M6DI18_9BACT|nr:TolC family protein [Roseiconus nitratireducens]KAA5545912.1 TolC family protein [Roseiconus nitratireducens]
MGRFGTSRQSCRLSIALTVAAAIATGGSLRAQSPIALPGLTPDPAPDPVEILPRPTVPLDPGARPPSPGDSSICWWTDKTTDQILDRQRWVSFDLETVLLDALANSPKIQSVAYQASATVQRIIEQDAAFDPAVLLGSNVGRTNDPVGNTLTTGGAPRLIEQSMNVRGGARQTTRRGTNVEWTQQLGLLDSNSTFFVPQNQGNSRLSLSLTKPLLSRGGRYYNERLITQARLESHVAWQDMRSDVEQRLADVITAYWQLYQVRTQLIQQRALLDRSRELETVLSSRQHFDAGRIEIAKARGRIARRADGVLDLEAELKRSQCRLAVLVGSEALIGADNELELIPTVAPSDDPTQFSLRDAVTQALENRPEIREATHQLELSALAMRVTRAELEPQLNLVFNGYLAQLTGNSDVAQSFWNEFDTVPGASAGVLYNMPYGRRASRARHREAQYRYRQQSEQLREIIQRTQFEVQSALIDVQRYAGQLVSKRKVLQTALEEETILTTRWRLIGGDESRVGIVLENLLDAQRRRTDAEKDLVAAEAAYMISQVRMQRSMGTLLINEGIQPTQDQRSGKVDFLHHQDADEGFDTGDRADRPAIPVTDPIQDAVQAPARDASPPMATAPLIEGAPPSETSPSWATPVGAWAGRDPKESVSPR